MPSLEQWDNLLKTKSRFFRVVIAGLLGYHWA
jgi:hypothetical protein